MPTRCVTVRSAEDQIQTCVPSVITSVSPSVPCTATRAPSCEAQTRIVVVPDSTEVRSAASWGPPPDLGHARQGGQPEVGVDADGALDGGGCRALQVGEQLLRRASGQVVPAAATEGASRVAAITAAPIPAGTVQRRAPRIMCPSSTRAAVRRPPSVWVR